MTTTTNSPGRGRDDRRGGHQQVLRGDQGAGRRGHERPGGDRAGPARPERGRQDHNLVRGGERVVLAARDKSVADSLAAGLGELASSATVADAVAQADTVVFVVWLDAGKELISRLSPALAGKMVIDPSNPVGPDGHGGLARTLPERESAASVVAKLLPAGARYVKAFGTVGAGELGSAARSEFGGHAEKKA